VLNKLLRLERPLAILDLETTGLNANSDRIIQIAVTIHYPNRDAIAWMSLVNPGVPITNQGSHKITDQDVAEAPTFKTIAPALAPKMLNVDISGHNVERFDIPFLKAEMARAGVAWDWKGKIIDTLSICRIKDAHTLENAYRRYVDPKGFEGGHDAGNDVAATEQLLAAQLNKHQDLPRTIEELAEFCENRNPNRIDKTGKFIWIGDQPCINFGKHKGKPMKNVEKPYFVWMINTEGFPGDAILIAGAALKGQFPVKK